MATFSFSVISTFKHTPPFCLVDHQGIEPCPRGYEPPARTFELMVHIAGPPGYPAGLVRLSAGLGASRSCTGWSSLILSLDSSIVCPGGGGRERHRGREGWKGGRTGWDYGSGRNGTAKMLYPNFILLFFFLFVNIIYIHLRTAGETLQPCSPPAAGRIRRKGSMHQKRFTRLQTSIYIHQHFLRAVRHGNTLKC